jgi:hypothetical protein
MKIRLNIVIVFILLVRIASAEFFYNVNRKTIINIQPINQKWTDIDSTNFSEFSIPLSMYFSFSDKLSFHIKTAQAMVNKDNNKVLSGITDTHVAMNYYMDPANLIFNLGVNLPSGKKELTSDEFDVSYLLSENHFDFKIPNFGQGLNLITCLSWAIPLNPNFVIGVGAGFLYRGSFKPRQDMVGIYDPGEEILVTAGFDLRLSHGTTFSLDAVYTHYSTDQNNGNDVFESGDKININMRFRKYYGLNELRLLGHYRSKDKNRIAIAGHMFTENQKSTPNEVEVSGYFKLHFHSNFYVRFLAEGRFYRKESSDLAINIYGFGLAPGLIISQYLSIPVILKYLNGYYHDGPDFSGFEIGGGLILEF